MVAVEEFRKLACVPVVPFEPWALRRGQAMLDLGQIQHQVVGPEAGPLADRGGLGRLEDA